MKKFIWHNYHIQVGSSTKWRTVYKNGYVGIRNEQGKWSPEHRVVMEKELGRKLASNEIVHHIDRDGTNNKLENLLICETPLEHKFAESYGQTGCLFYKDIIKEI